MKKIITLLLAIMLMLTFSACSTNTAKKEDQTDNKKQETVTSNEETAEKTLKIGCVSATEPCVQIMKESLAGSGYSVEIVVFNGNNLPAEALNAGDIDGLFANSLKWMNTFNEKNSANLSMAMPYYFSYAGLYSLKWNTPEEFPNNSQIVISNGLSNIDSALRILQNAGLIKLSEKPSENDFYSVLDIVENPKNITVIPSELTTAMSSINDVDGVVASAVIVRDSKVMSPSEHMALSTRDQMTPQGLIVNEKDLEADWVKVTMEKMQQQQYYDEFNELFDGTFILYSEIDKYFPQ